MKTAVSFGPAVPVASETTSAEIALAEAKSRLSAFVALTKPRITVMVLVTVATGFLLGARGASNPSTLFLTVLGTALVASGASTWNQLRSLSCTVRPTSASSTVFKTA